ncbi:PorP/SprF family type IX secretion system membrane protein [Rasiella sp. SM2506]|uniref:PorP/SprF family type IX secretion system membrane protein n=1 Tax=Rasiella sp. SM2506 TaxID=3423914 RepID=UPI003D7AB263
MKHTYIPIIILIMLSSLSSVAQQDPQYTQYMYNTQVVNPAYAGSRDVLSFGLLYRSQWVGFDGAPKTGTFTVNSPIGALDNMGLGLSITSDEIGPANESNINVDYSYSIPVSETGEISFGVKAGIDILDVDFSKLDIFDPNDPLFQNNVDNKIQPQIGSGIYYNTNKFYVGLSVPNFLTTKHFDENSLSGSNIASSSIAAERLHYFLIAGYVFDLGENLKFKPATLVKAVSGSPLQWDASANFLIHEKFTIGAAYRWSAAISGLVGFQATEGLFLGFGYDYQTTDIEDYSDGSYELILRFDLFNRPERVVAPRFF